jgi:hypothetical protein
MRAIKVIKKNQVIPEEESKLMCEIEILRQLVILTSHPRIILT